MTTMFPELETLKIAVALPSYDGQAINRVPVAMMARQCPLAEFIPTQTSLLAACFNLCLSQAMRWRDQGKCDYFLMIHADIFPSSANWFEQLWGAYKDSGAQLICAVSPIKSEKGLTSIGIDVEDVDAEKEARDLLDEFEALVREGQEIVSSEHGAVVDAKIKLAEQKIISAMTGYPAHKRQFLSAPRRLTMKECHAGPKTFTHPRILLNTGCMLFDMREPWVDQAVENGVKKNGPGRMYFHIDDSIQWIDGEPHTRGASEDWNFTRMARAAGCPPDKIFATLAMPLEHVGQMRFPTAIPWGTLDRDDAIPPLQQPVMGEKK